MTWYYVYGPLHGYCTSCIEDRTYCSGDCGSCCQDHPIPLGGSWDVPIDLIINTPGAQRLDFYGSPSIGSIRTQRKLSVMCGSGTPSGAWWDAVQVDMYKGHNGTGAHIGGVLFGHCASPIANGTYNLTNGVKTGIGWTPTDTCSCGCYIGMHVHLQTYAWAGYNGAALDGCGNPWATVGQTWIYEFEA